MNFIYCTTNLNKVAGLVNSYNAIQFLWSNKSLKIKPPWNWIIPVVISKVKNIFYILYLHWRILRTDYIEKHSRLTIDNISKQVVGQYAPTFPLVIWYSLLFNPVIDVELHKPPYTELLIRISRFFFLNNWIIFY